MSDPNRNWMEDEPPSCLDCRHFRPRGRDGEDPLMFGQCAVPVDYIVWVDIIRRNPLFTKGCGIEGKFFERKDREAGEYDFERDPPVPMAWAL